MIFQQTGEKKKRNPHSVIWITKRPFWQVKAMSRFPNGVVSSTLTSRFLLSRWLSIFFWFQTISFPRRFISTNLKWPKSRALVILFFFRKGWPIGSREFLVHWHRLSWRWWSNHAPFSRFIFFRFKKDGAKDTHNECEYKIVCSPCETVLNVNFVLLYLWREPIVPLENGTMAAKEVNVDFFFFCVQSSHLKVTWSESFPLFGMNQISKKKKTSLLKTNASLRIETNPQSFYWWRSIREMRKSSPRPTSNAKFFTGRQFYNVTLLRIKSRVTSRVTKKGNQISARSGHFRHWEDLAKSPN